MMLAEAALARTFMQRSVQMLERLSESASQEVLNAALASPSDIGGMAEFLSNVAPMGVDLSTVDPLAESLARGASIKQELLSRAGGALSVSQVAAAMDMTRQGVDKRRQRGTLLAVPNGAGEFIYPACQFTEDGLVPHIDKVLAAFAVKSPWTRLSVLMAPAPALRGKSVLEALKGGEVERAVAVVAAYGE